MSDGVGRIVEAWSPAARAAALRARELKARNGVTVQVGHSLLPSPEVAGRMERKVSGVVNHVGPTFVSVTPHGGGKPELLTHGDVETYYHAKPGIRSYDPKTGPSAAEKARNAEIMRGRSVDAIKAELDDHLKRTGRIPPSHARYKAVSAKRVALQRELKAAQGSK